eukprot:3933041-Rhodomonas_salina.1
MPAKQSSGLHFFPVNNTKGQDDEVLRELMATMERTVEAEAYVKKKVPLKWVAVYEELRRDTRTAITFAELCAIARKHKLPSSADVALELEVKYMALFFSGLGFIMYHDEPSLSDLVVLDPAKFLIEPASTLICNPSLHVIKEHSTVSPRLAVVWGPAGRGRSSRCSTSSMQAEASSTSVSSRASGPAAPTTRSSRCVCTGSRACCGVPRSVWAHQGVAAGADDQVRPACAAHLECNLAHRGQRRAVPCACAAARDSTRHAQHGGEAH